MSFDVKNIDKNDKNTWRTLYKEIDEPYSAEVKLFHKLFLDYYEKFKWTTKHSIWNQEQD